MTRSMPPGTASAWSISITASSTPSQHYSLVDALTVWENVALGERGGLDPSATRDKVIDITERYGLEVDPDAHIRELTAGVRQRVEIIKCLRHEPRIIILDEPTAVLTPTESEQLFDVLLEGVRREGWAVALVSHKLDEVLAATHRIIAGAGDGGSGSESPGRCRRHRCRLR